MEDWQRAIDRRLERIEELLTVVVRIEERQTNQAERFGALERRVTAVETRVQAVDRKVDKWVQRGIGLWAGVSTLLLVAWTVFTFVVNK